MGSESQCRVDIRGFGGKSKGVRSAVGKALLETDDLIFRGAAPDGDVRLKLRFGDVARVDANGDVLVVELRDGSVARFHLGRSAARWAEKIRRPPSRLEKLGVKPGARVAIAGDADTTFTAELETAGASPAKPPSADLVFLFAPDLKALARVGKLRAQMRDDAAIWVVYPKGRKDIREADVLGAGRATGMKDVKVARFSDTQTALKFVVPVADRR